MNDGNKRNRIVNWVIRPLVLLVVFVTVFFVSAAIMNRNSQGVTAEMKDCTFPTITVLYKGQQMNRMYGYADAMQAGGSRGAATLLDENNQLDIRIQTYGTEVRGIRYEVRSLDMERLVEETSVKEFQEFENTIEVHLGIQDLLSENEEYQLMICLDTAVDSDIYYYTRIRKDGAYYAKESLDFVLDFHGKTRQKDNADAIVKYLESSTEGDNSSFQHVDIHSSYELVTWGDLEILSVEDMDVTLQEINNQTAVIMLDYMLVLKNAADETEHYDVTEYYRVRYTQERMYLLDFERTMNQFFEIDNQVLYSTAVQLGITSPDTTFEETGNGKIVSFVQQGELFCYDSTGNTLAKIFGFWQKDKDVRCRNDQHQIQIINVDEQGNTDFVVYGYMNRGIHEGKVGISVCHYDRVTNATEEYAFLEYDKSYQLLKEEAKELLYLNSQEQFYIHLNRNLYEIDMASRAVKILAEDIDASEFAVSADRSLLVIQKEDELADSVELTYMNLQTGKTKNIVAQNPDTERIRPVGFIGNDFVYGIARTENITYDSDGKAVFAMHKLIIEDAGGTVLKEYEPAGIYILRYEIRENVLELGRAVKSADGLGYQAVESDQIIHNAGNSEKAVTLKAITTEKKKKEYQLNFGFSLPSGEKKNLRPKEVLLENVQNICLEDSNKQPVSYYVYCKGELAQIYGNAAEAIAKAEEEAGVVVNSSQEYIWERVKRQTECRLDGLETISAENGNSSLEASLLSILRYNGKGTMPGELLEQGMSPYSILKQELGENHVVNLTGVSLDKVLYCLDKGYPVLASTGSGNYVVLVGYNGLNTVIMNPAEGTTGYVGMNDSIRMFEQARNTFIACIP